MSWDEGFLGARASRPHKTWQGRGDWLHRVGRFTRRLTLEQRLDKYAGGTPALPGGNPWLALPSSYKVNRTTCFRLAFDGVVSGTF